MPSSRARMPSSGPLIAALTLSTPAGVTAPSPGFAGYSPDFAGSPLPRLRRVLPRLRGGERLRWLRFGTLHRTTHLDRRRGGAGPRHAAGDSLRGVDRTAWAPPA